IVQGGSRGEQGNPGAQSARVLIYRRSSTTPVLPSSTATYTFADGSISGLNNSWTATIPAGTDPLWVSAATAFGTGATDTIAPTEWASPVVLVENGSDGVNTATVYLLQRNNTGAPPSVPSGTLTYTFSTATLSGDLEGWSQSAPHQSEGRFLWVTTATAVGTGATDTISSGEWAQVQLLAQDGEKGDKGDPGPQGPEGPQGPPGADGQNVARVRIYRRSSSTPSLPTGTATFTFATGAITGLNNSWSGTIPDGTAPLWISEATAMSSGATDTIAPNEWATPVVLVRDGKDGVDGADGADGINSATVFLFRRTNTDAPPSVPSGNLTYTFATGVLSGNLQGWSQSVPDPSGGRFLWATTATALGTGATDSIGPSEWATPRVLAKDGQDAFGGNLFPDPLNRTATMGQNGWSVEGGVTVSIGTASVGFAEKSIRINGGQASTG